MNCKQCGYQGPHRTEILTSGVHYAKELCGKCHRWVQFLEKPNSDSTKYRRPKSHTNLVKKYSRGFCELCLRKKEHLPKGTTLEAQHVLEYSKHEGSSERENIWIVCTMCQRLIHWLRTYRYKHDGDLLIGGAVDQVMDGIQEPDDDCEDEEHPDIPF